jgi:hypothetical protein
MHKVIAEEVNSSPVIMAGFDPEAAENSEDIERQFAVKAVHQARMIVNCNCFYSPKKHIGICSKPSKAAS